MTEMAIFQDVDKCMRCSGCVISCKRTWQMKADNPGVHKVEPDTRLMIKSQKRIDMGPYVRFSCWHCPDPPCVKRCPTKALAKQANGAVSTDPDLCDPTVCNRECTVDCKRSGYPKIGDGSDLFATDKSWKCTLCWGRAGSDADIQEAVDQRGAEWGPFALPNNGNKLPGTAVVDAMDHEPSCVYTCPAKAMKWDTKDNVVNYINDAAYDIYAYHNEGDDWYISAQGDGNVFWASKSRLLLQPKADPFIEDHVTPMVSNVLNSPFAKAALVPTIFVGGLLAVIARRQQNMGQSVGTREG